MPLFEFQLAVIDEVEAHRKKEGDVVNITKHPSLGNGRKTICEYLIVVVDVKAKTDLQQLRLHFKQAALVGGYNEWEVEGLDTENPDDLLIINSKLYLDPVKHRGGYIERPVKLGKNRYSIELLVLKATWSMYELDLEKVKDKLYIYQPFKTVEDVLIGKPELIEEVDCGTKPSEFIVVRWSDAEPIVWDNALGKVIGPSDIGLKEEKLWLPVDM